MSEPDWHAALVFGNRVTVWPMSGDAPLGNGQTHALSEFSDLPGPVVAAGLDVSAIPVPAQVGPSTTYAANLPHVAAIPMMQQDRPAALTRGAETAVAGYLSTHTTFDGVLLVLGAETCWVHVSAREVVSFQSFLTPELAAALGAEPAVTNADFTDALTETLSRPDRLAQQLASARAARTGQSLAHLIGAEIAAAKPYWLGQTVVILGDEASTPPYLHALRNTGTTVQTYGFETALIAGLAQAWKAVASGPSSC